MSYRRCAAKTCFNTHNCRPNLKFFNFPKDAERCQQWIINCGRLDFLTKPIDQISKFVLCADHFEEECFINPAFKTVFRKFPLPIPNIFRNNLADFVPKSLQKNCEALNAVPNTDNEQTVLVVDQNSSMTFIQDDLESMILSHNQISDSDTCLNGVISNVFSSLMVDVLPVKEEEMSEADGYYLEDETHKEKDEAYASPPDFIGCHKMCRLCACLVYEDNLISIFIDKNEEDSLLIKINAFLPEKITVDDGLPQLVCIPCVNKLTVCSNIINFFILADTKLRNIFFGPTSTLHEIELQVSGVQNTHQLTAAIQGEENEIGSDEFLNLNNDNRLLYDSALIVKPSSKRLSVKKIVSLEESLDEPISELDDMTVADMKSTELTGDDHIPEELMEDPFGFENPGASYFLEENKTNENNDDTNYSGSQSRDKLSDKAMWLMTGIDDSLESRVAIDSVFLQKSVYRKREIQTCDECGETFVGMKPLRRHIRQNHTPAANTCEFCGARFKIVAQLESHRRLHTGEKPFACTICDERFHFRKQLRRHRPTHVKKPDLLPVVCHVCNKECANRSALWRHKKTHSDEGNSLCFQCGKVLSSPASLRVHMRTHSSERPCSCETCGKTFRDKMSLSKHSLTHLEEKSFPCNICGRLFSNLSLVRQHQLSHSGVKPFKCDQCNTAFNRRGNLNQHKKKHKANSQLNKLLYECLMCGKKVGSELTLKYHQAKHTGEKRPYDCEVCGKRFISADPYRVHMRLHTGERPYECPVCQKTFRSSGTMKQHVALHKDEHPHSCPYCERRFKRLQSLIVHRRTHTGERPFACHICSRAFAQRGDMVKHTKTHLRSRTAKCEADDEQYVMHIDSITELALSDSDITSEYLIDMPIVEVETVIHSETDII